MGQNVLSSRVTLVVLLLVLAAFLLKGYLNVEPPYEIICEEYRHILLKTRELVEESASPPQWMAFEQDVQGRIAPYVAELDELSKQVPLPDNRAEDMLNHFVRSPLYRLGKYDLPRLIKDARAGETLEDKLARVEDELSGVQRAMEVIRMGEAPKIEQRR